MDSQTIAYITTVIAAASLIISGITVRIANRQAKAAERQTNLQRQLREDAAQPYIWVDVRSNDAQGFTLDLVACQRDGTTLLPRGRDHLGVWLATRARLWLPTCTSSSLLLCRPHTI